MTADTAVTLVTYAALAFNLGVAVWSVGRVRRWQRVERAQMQAWADREQEQHARWQAACAHLQAQREDMLSLLLAQRPPLEHDHC